MSARLDAVAAGLGAGGFAATVDALGFLVVDERLTVDELLVHIYPPSGDDRWVVYFIQESTGEILGHRLVDDAVAHVVAARLLDVLNNTRID